MSRQPGTCVGSFGESNTAAVTHGGYSLIRKLKDGEPFKGLALDLQEQARADLEMHGAIEAMRQAYARHAGAALFLQGIIAGLDDLPSIEKYQRLTTEFRRLNERTFEMARQLAEMERAAGDGLIIDAVQAAREAQDGHNQTD